MKKLPLTKNGKSQKLYAQAKKIIPGGTQLLSKRPEMFLPDYWPAYYKKAKGCEVWDLDGNRFIDMSYMGVGSCILGYADADVNKAVDSVVRQGSMTTLNAPEEVELAQVLLKLHPWAGMARFARTGGEAVSMAVRIARASTARDIVLFCGYHGWHDWYLSSNLADKVSLDGQLLPGLEPAGVVRGLKQTAVPFKYNDINSFLALMKKYKGKIAAVIMEPVRNHDPQAGFLEKIRTETQREKIVFIVDEVSSGWRLNLGGAHLKFKIAPDMAVFAKGMSNGYPMAAVIGTGDVMKAAQNSFISSTYWTERIGPAAALATLKKFKQENVASALQETGRKIQEGWKKCALKNQLKITVSGIYPLGHFSFDHQDALVLKTLFTQGMLERGFLATTAFYAAYAHQSHHTDKYLQATDEVFHFIAKGLASGKPQKYLKGPVAHTGFRRLT